MGDSVNSGKPKRDAIHPPNCFLISPIAGIGSPLPSALALKSSEPRSTVKEKCQVVNMSLFNDSPGVRPGFFSSSRLVDVNATEIVRFSDHLLAALTSLRDEIYEENLHVDFV